jgi:hypothetical protein
MPDETFKVFAVYRNESRIAVRDRSPLHYGAFALWITHRPSTLQPNETRSIWKAAPPVLEFDADGTLVSSWGGPGAGYDWPQYEHGIYVDDNDNVWLGAGGEKDAHILKFTRAGKSAVDLSDSSQVDRQVQ